MSDQTKEGSGSDRRQDDRRIQEDQNYKGPDRRKGDRRTGERRRYPRE